MASQLRLSVLNIYYRYDPITDSDTSRLLVLEPGQGKDPLVGKLATLDLRQPVAYEAVSYTWGNESTQDQITLESKRLDLTPSLGTALRRLRLRDRQRVIWVDQISINQKDTVERSNQVGLMNGIYRKATKVLVWLGEGPDGHGAKALRFMKSLDAIFKDELLNELFRQQGEQLDWFPEEHWAALRKLLQNPWFSRVWIPQEIGTEAPAQVLIGDITIDWEFMHSITSTLGESYALWRKHQVRVAAVTHLYRRFIETRDRRHRRNFVYELHRARDFEASDPRDRVFALLGHYSARWGPDGSPIIEPDYNNSVDLIYHETAIRTLNKEMHFITLNAVQNRPGFEASHKTPTWVPRWDDGWYQGAIIGWPSSFQASGSQPAVLSFDSTFTALTMEGVLLDVVKNVSVRLSSVVFRSPDQSASHAGTTAAATMWTKQCGHKSFSLEPRYVAGDQPALTAYLDTLTAAQNMYHRASRSWETRWPAGADFVVRVFGQSKAVLVEQDVRDAAKAGEYIKFVECAACTAGSRTFATTVKGYYILGPAAAEKGDVVCVLFGGKTPYMLRPKGDHYLFVGECYVHGIMDGEAIGMMERGEKPVTRFQMR